MSTNSLEHLKQAKTSLKAERKPVSQVQDALIQAKEITEFVSVALSKENRWILQSGEQESIVTMLKEINLTKKELYDKCRSPEHFSRDADRFLRMKHKINRQAECIHLSLDQGFYNTEPLGFSAGKAVELSLKQIHSIHDGLQQGKWSRLPIEATAEDSAKKEVENLLKETEPLGDQLLKNKNVSTFDPPMTMEEVQSVYKYFQNVSRIQELEKQAMVDAISKKSAQKLAAPDEILENLSSFERKLKNIKIPGPNKLPGWGIDLYNVSRTDMFIRMHLLRIPFEPLGFLKKHLKTLEEKKEADGTEKCIADFHEHVAKQLEHLQLFIEIFGGVGQTLSEVTGILQNLSISFGKIYHNSSSQNITSNFLVKALELIKGMLEKGSKVADSKSQKLQELRQSVREFNLFDDPINEGILHALDLLDQGKKEIGQYCEQIHASLAALSSTSELDSRTVYQYLKKAYDDNARLTSAAMIFGSVTQTCSLLDNSIREVESMLKNLVKLPEQHPDASALYEQTISFLGNEPELTENNLKHSMEQVEELNWILDEMFGHGAEEEQRYLDELHSELRPVNGRVQAQKIKEAAKQAESAEKEVKKSKTTAPNQSKSRKSKKGEEADPLSRAKRKNIYDPFEPYEMTAIKDACKQMTSSEGKMIYQVMTNTHTFFTLLNKLESTFKAGEGLENELEQDLEKSKTTQEFLNNFARLKFLPHGYCSNSNTPLDYNQATCLFEAPKGMEKHLKLSKSSIGTPMQVFKRLLRSMLGMDDPKTLATIMSPQVLSIFEEDYMLKSEDRKALEEALQKT